MKWLKFSLPAVLLIFIAVFAVPRLGAESYVKGFKSASSLQPGWVVSISKSASDTVVPTTGNSSDSAYGVVIDPSDAPFTLNSQDQQVFVASGGDYPVLVSTQNGAIHIGDYLGISSITGIAAKATDDQRYIIGVARAAFDGKNNVITTSSDDKSAIGRVVATITPGQSPLLKTNTGVPAPLLRIGESIAGRPISAIRIYAALSVFIIAALIAAALLWIGVRSSITAIGRNPLSRHLVMAGLGQVVIMAVAVFIIGLFGIYLLLRL
jgi:hypothetical protein